MKIKLMLGMGSFSAFTVLAGALAGCSTIESLSPFDNVPYAQNINPTVPRPASPEKSIYQTPAPANPPPAPEEKATDKNGSSGSSAPAGQPVQSKAEIPADQMHFKDDGTYPNLAQVPSRPPDLPTFASVAADQKVLEQDVTTATSPAPQSPPPGTESTQDKTQQNNPQTKPVQPVPVGYIPPRPEDHAPCLDAEQAKSTPTASVSFAQGSAALTADSREILAEAIPSVRSYKGTIRVLGQGDNDPGSAQGANRFDLAVTRAGAVVEALAGFGIPASRIAIGVACSDSALGASSVQLYTDS